MTVHTMPSRSNRQILAILCPVSLGMAMAGSALGQNRGDLTEFVIPTSGSRPYTICAGPDGNLWFTESNGNKIGRITTAGVITEFPVPTTGSGPYGITVGADGNLWFTERFGNRIGRITPTGAITEYDIPTGFAQPWEIAAGFDGNLWFTEEDVNQIGRITLSGQISEYVPPTCCFPTGICPGADGNMWFTIEIGDQIGRITPTGSFSIYQINSVQVLPWDIAPGPDGNVWFTELAGRAIGRITPNGDITEFPVSGSFSGIAGITTGPDGNLFFTENDTANVGLMTPRGRVPGKRPVGERPLSITLGPDGNLWFTEADANRIGRITWADPDTVYVLALDSGFVPAARTAKLGDTVRWVVQGPRGHGVVDSSGLNLFNSGTLPIVSYFDGQAVIAATFEYHDSVNVNHTGEIGVPMDVPDSGTVGTPFGLRWALLGPLPNTVFDVEVKTPGSPTFEALLTGTTDRQGQYTPTEAGTYQFRSRLRRGAAAATEYSPPASIDVH